MFNFTCELCFIRVELQEKEFGYFFVKINKHNHSSEVNSEKMLFKHIENLKLFYQNWHTKRTSIDIPTMYCIKFSIS